MNADGRLAFQLFEGFALSAVLSSLEIEGLLDRLAGTGRLVDDPAGGFPDAVLRYLVQRGIAEERGDGHALTAFGECVRADIGYLIWLSGGYGVPLRSAASFVTGARAPGDHAGRDGRAVAVGSAVVGRGDLVPQAMELLGTVEPSRALDLGCGNAHLLMAVCERFGITGVGVDENAEACAEAGREVDARGLADRVGIVRADAAEVGAVLDADRFDLVIAFFLLHEILASGRDALVRYLRGLSRRLPASAHLLIAEVAPAEGAHSGPFAPEFTLVHSMMGQTLLGRDEWFAVLAEGGFRVVREQDCAMPSGLLLLAGNAR
ncbi:methyltransferase domain-containing protein [Actinosynnema sp. NPDC050436]|uniref:SAM-dependent methyltransferase n=1 Tax=Actinosynnema sp. NPDC050436 TaxID=3155659 RepID=UPI00341071AF